MFKFSTIPGKVTVPATLFAALLVTSTNASAASTSRPLVAPQQATAQQAFPRGIGPDIGLCLGYSSQIYWVETSTNPQQWSAEEYGEFCPPKILYTCTGTETQCQLYYWVSHVTYVRAYAYAQVKYVNTLLVPSGSNGTNVLAVTGRTTQIAGTLGLVTSTQTATAAATFPKTATTYVSVSNAGGPGQAEVLVYQGGSSTPTGVLTDPAAGTTAAGITVDSRGNVFWAVDDPSGNGYIDEFVKGNGSPKRLQFGPEGRAGDLTDDRRDDLVVASPATSQVQVYSPKAGLIGSFATTGSPASISLDEKNANLYVADTANNLIDDYAYPSGTLISSSSPPQLDGQTPFLQAVLAPNPQAG